MPQPAAHLPDGEQIRRHSGHIRLQLLHLLLQ